MITYEEMLAQNRWLRNKIICLIFYRDDSPKIKIDGKIYVQASGRFILNNFQRQYSLMQIKRTFDRLIKEKILLGAKSDRKNEGYYYTLNDKLYKSAYKKALTKPHHKIPLEFLEDEDLSPTLKEIEEMDKIMNEIYENPKLSRKPKIYSIDGYPIS